MKDLLVYVLFQTDVYQSESSRVFFGVFSSWDNAVDAAKEEDLYTNDSEVVIIETTLDEFSEV